MKIGPKVQLLVVIALFLAFLVAEGLIYQRERRAQAQLESQTAKLAPVLQKPAPAVAQVQAKLDQIQSRIKTARAAFPGKDESIGISESLYVLANSQGVVPIKQLASTGWKREGSIEFYLVTFDLTLEGEVKGLLDFVSGLDSRLQTARIGSAAIVVPRPEDKPATGKAGEAAGPPGGPTVEVKVAVYTEGKEVDTKKK